MFSQTQTGYCGLIFTLSNQSTNPNNPHTNYLVATSHNNVANYNTVRTGESIEKLQAFDISFMYDPATKRIVSVRKNLKLVLEGDGKKKLLYMKILQIQNQH